MNKFSFKSERSNDKFYRVNERIRFSPVMVVDDKGQNLGSMSTDEARKIAKEAGFDLVEVAPNARPPVCRIMDFGKFKYEQGLKEKQQRAKQKTCSLKELRLTPKIAENDIMTKVNLARKFLEQGHKVQFKLLYSKRENAHKDLGFVVIKKVLEELSDVALTERQPKMEGNILVCVVEPKEKSIQK